MNTKAALATDRTAFRATSDPLDAVSSSVGEVPDRPQGTYKVDEREDV